MSKRTKSMMRQTRMYLSQSPAQDALFELASIDLDGCAVHVALGAWRKDDILARLQKLEMSPGLAEKFRAVVRQTLEDLQDDLHDGNLEVLPYDAGEPLEQNHVLVLNVAAHDEVRLQMQPLAAPLLMEPFAEKADFVSSLRFYAIIVQPPEGEPVFCFRSYAPRFELQRSPLFAALKGRGKGYYDQWDDDGFLFDHEIDCFCHGTDMYVLNKHKFQYIFQFYEYVEKKAKLALEAIKKTIPIANMDEFITSCLQDSRMTGALASLTDAPHLDKLTITRIKRTIDRYNLNIEIIEVDGREMLNYSPGQRWELLKLLRDSYLASHMTDFDYEVGSKRALRSPD